MISASPTLSPAIDYEYVSEEERRDLHRQLLTQRLAQQEREHVAAKFAVEQIEAGLDEVRRALAALEQGVRPGD